MTCGGDCFILLHMSNSRNKSDGLISKMLKALGNPNRLSIFKRLATCCPPGTACNVQDATTCVGEVGRKLNIAPSTLSHHLKELHHAGLIDMERQGKQVQCSVKPEALRVLSGFFQTLSPEGEESG